MEKVECIKCNQSPREMKIGDICDYYWCSRSASHICENCIEDYISENTDDIEIKKRIGIDNGN